MGLLFGTFVPYANHPPDLWQEGLLEDQLPYIPLNVAVD